MTRTLLIIILAALAALTAPLAAIDSGVLIPSDQSTPDADTLSLAEMRLEIRIDNGTARVELLEIFRNHTNRNLEGVYHFALPSRAVLSAFAVWDDLVRIPGVIMERRRAGELYDSLRPRVIDPGLLQMGERGSEEAALNSEFTARIMPIPAWGTKRIEIAYDERLAVEDFESVLAVPLEPDVYQAQVAGRFDVHLTIESDRPLGSFAGIGNAYPLTVGTSTPNRIEASFSGTNVPLSEDFAVRFGVAESEADTLRVLSYRDANVGSGFFQVSGLFGTGGTVAGPDSAPARTVVAVFDSSLSMQWNKLDASYSAFESLLRSLRPRDRFNVVVFNSDVSLLSPSPQPATIENLEAGLAFVRQSRLRGATDLMSAIEAALDQTGENPYVVLFTDGGSTAGPVANGRLLESFTARWNGFDPEERPRMFVFGVGDDANLPLLREIGAANGVFEWVRSTEPIDFKVEQFIAKIGRFPISELSLEISPTGAGEMIYPLESTVFGGAVQAWVGRYPQPESAVTFTAGGLRDGDRFELSATAPLPADATVHEALPRTWARARVDALLAGIERNGEDRDAIEEIIRLSREFTFVTPYTSFLAAPRSLLRPRVIRPGDPILRVETDPSIVSVVAVFPFGLVKPLRYLDDEAAWQTRFLAPPDMPDGTHTVEIVMRDEAGNAYREAKTFVISSQPPVVRVRLDREQYRPGEAVHLRVGASETTRTIVARMYGVAPVDLRWDPEAGWNTGQFRIPADLPPGDYRIVVTAEDFAHNIGTGEVTLAVLP